MALTGGLSGVSIELPNFDRREGFGLKGSRAFTISRARFRFRELKGLGG